MSTVSTKQVSIANSAGTQTANLTCGSNGELLHDGVQVLDKTVMNVTGSAPIYACRAWVNFDGTTAANVSGTYSQSGTTVTVTLTNHGHKVGHVIYSDIVTL